MMDTILNLGLNDDAVEGLAQGDRQPALRVRLVPPPDPDVRRGGRGHRRAPLRARAHRPEGASAASQQDVELDANDLRELVGTYERIYEDETGSPFPQDAREQLGARGPRRLRVVGHAARAGLPARAPDPGRPRHRRQRRPDGLRQQGRGAPAPASRSRATRRPGEHGLYGEFLADAQGEDVVAGIRTPEPLAAMRGAAAARRSSSCRTRCSRLEEHYSDMQDIEFTVEDGRLYLLQTRSAKRTAAAALKAAVSMVGGGPDLARGGGRADRPGASSTSCCTR